MYLKSLLVEAGGREVRFVEFRRGLNLIVDETSKLQRSDSGNNVGKTTALRCVDYCLEADPKSLYLDREWKRPNEKVFAFLQEKRPTFVLELESLDGSRHQIVRTFDGKERLLNGKPISGNQMAKELKALLFRVEENKPTLRQLSGKFIRLSTEAKSHTMKWLHSSTSDAEYDILWLTLFGFRLTSMLNARRSQQKLLVELSRRKDEIDRVAKSPRQARTVIERELAEANRRLQELSIAGAHDKDLHRLQGIRLRIAELSQQLAEAEGHVLNGNRTLEQLRGAIPRVGTETIREVYADAERLIDSLHASYEQLVQFHNSMLKNKASFTQRTKARWEHRVAELREQLGRMAADETALLRSFSSPDIWADIRRLNDEIIRLSKQQGYMEGLESELSKLTYEIKSAKARIADADAAIESERDAMETHLEGFNRYFSDFSRRLFGLSFFLALRLDETKRGQHKVVPSITNIEAHEGSGMKRAGIAAFDLAYLRWQQERRAKTIRFTLHDELELIYGNQLATLFEIADGIDGQFVVPFLSDRLSSVPFAKAKDCTILRLSGDNRFFRIP